MYWWELLIPGVAIALLIRIVAIFGPKYFSWIELLSIVAEESLSTRSERRRAMAQRLAVPLVVTAAWTLVRPETSWLDAAIIGAFAGGLMLWPMVFHGPPLGIYVKDWLLLPVYGSFVLLLATSALLGNLAVNPLPALGGLSYIVSNITVALLVACIGALLWWVYDVSAAALSQQIHDRRKDII